MDKWVPVIVGALAVLGGSVAVALGFTEGQYAVSFGLGMLAGRVPPRVGPKVAVMLALVALPMTAACGGAKVTTRTVCEAARDGACTACAMLNQACPALRGSSQPAGDTIGGSDDGPCDADVRDALAAEAAP